MGWYENKVKRNMDYNKDNVRRYNLSLNKNTDQEMIAWLDSKEKYSVYIKQLIAEDMKRGK